MFIFSILVQKVNFERSHLQKVGVVLAYFLYVNSLLWMLVETCFKALKVGQIFLPLKWSYLLILHKSRLWAITVSEVGLGTLWILFSCVVFISSIRRKLLDEYCYHWNVHFCYFWTKNWFWAITVSEDWCGFNLILFIWAVFIAHIRGKLFWSSI